MGIKRDVLITLALAAIALVIVAGLVGLALVAVKAFGVLLLLVGVFLVVFFPGVSDYQPTEMADLGVKIGFVLVIAGLAVLFLL